MELTIRQKFDAIIPKEDIDFLKKFNEMKVRANVIEEQLKEASKDFLISNNLTEEGYEQDGIRFTYVKPSVRRVADTKKMKEHGIYEDYTKESKVSDSVRISYVYED